MEEQLKYIDLALRISGFNFHKKDLELIINVINKVEETKGKTDLKTLTKIIADNETKYKEA